MGLYAGLLAAGAMLAGTAQAETVLQFNRWLPPGHFIQKDLLKAWAADVEEVTDGRVKVEITASSLGPPPRQFDLVRQGVADIVWAPQGYTPDRFLTSQGIELPFLGDSAEALSVAYWKAYKKHFKAAGEYEGIKLLALHTHPPGQIYTSERPLKTLDDLEGVKLRVPNPATAQVAEAFGAAAVTAPSSKVYELLSRGVVDGTFLTNDAVPQFKITEFIDYRMAVENGFFNAAFMLAMNEGAWDEISDVDRKAIEGISGRAFAKRAGALWDAEAERGTATLEAAGVSTTRVTGEMLETLHAELAHIEENWIEAVGKVGVDGAAALKTIRRTADNYEAE